MGKTHRKEYDPVLKFKKKQKRIKIVKPEQVSDDFALFEFSKNKRGIVK